MKTKAVAKLSARAPVKVETLSHFAPLPKALKSHLAFPKDFKGGAVVDKNGIPRLFVFDTSSLWDLLCAVDTVFETSVPSKEYVFNNPVGWMIDAIEGRLPVAPQVVAELRRRLEEAKRLGTVSFEAVKRRLGLP